MPLQKFKTDSEGSILSTRTVYDRDRPLCFDYKMISEKFGIILDSETAGAGDDDEDDEHTQTCSSKGKGKLSADSVDDLPF